MKYNLKKFQPLRIRIWHWLNALVVIGLLLTVLLRKTLLSWRSNAALIEEKAKAAGSLITPELAKSIAIDMKDRLWDWHIYLGYALSAIFIIRIYSFCVSLKKKEPGLPEALRGLRSLPPESKPAALHYTLVKAGYAVFYLGLVIMIVTGLSAYFDDFLGIPRETSHSLGEIHEALLWPIVAFIAIHLLGVVVAENRTDRGIVSDMINGGTQE